MRSSSYKDLIAWQKSCILAVDIYKLTSDMPKKEQFGLISQMQRASVSIASNIAEGSKRNTNKDFVHFLTIAHGSSAELETQLIILKELNFVNNEKIDILIEKTNEVMRILGKLIYSIKNKN